MSELSKSEKRYINGNKSNKEITIGIDLGSNPDKMVETLVKINEKKVQKLQKVSSNKNSLQSSININKNEDTFN